MIKSINLIITMMLISFNSFAVSATTSAKLSSGIALENMQAYARSDLGSQKVGIVNEGMQLIEHITLLRTKPGIAFMENKSNDVNIEFDRGAPVEIWEYLEDGFSKVVINEKTYTTRIARSKTECLGKEYNRRYCWVRVVEEPEYYEWKQVSLEPEGQRFWVLNRIIDGSGIISVKDKTIQQSKVLETKYIDKQEAEEKAKQEQAANEEPKEEPLKITPDLMDGVDLPSDPLQRKLIEDLLKPKEVKEKERQAKKEAEAKKKFEQKREIPQEEVFEQTNLKDNQSLNANFSSKTTTESITNINKEMDDVETTKLELKANQPLTLE